MACDVLYELHMLQWKSLNKSTKCYTDTFERQYLILIWLRFCSFMNSQIHETMHEHTYPTGV